MHKCQSCGTEFEGKFCPECGTKWAEERQCPHCGAALPENVKFCTECGQPLSGESVSLHPEQYATPVEPIEQPVKPVKNLGKTPKGTSPLLQKLYPILGKLPLIAFFLFSLLTFFFYLAPVAVMPGGELFGEKIPSQSYGNVYQMSGYVSFPKLQGPMTALIVFAVIALAVAVAWVVLRKKAHKVRLGLSFGGLLLELIYLIIASVMLGVIKKTDGGLGLIAAGAAPKLMLAFSIILLVLHAGCLIGRFLLARFYPVLPQAEQKAEEAARKAKELAHQKKLQKLRENLPEPVDPNPQKPEMGENLRPVAEKVGSIVKRKRILAILFAMPLIAGGVFGILFGILDLAYLVNDYSLRTIFGGVEYYYGYEIPSLILSGIIAAIAFVALIVFLCILGKKKIVCTPEKLKKNSGAKAVEVLSGIFAFGALAAWLALGLMDIIFYIIYQDIFGYYILWSVCALPPFIYYIIIFAKIRKTIKARKKLCIELYGTAKPTSYNDFLNEALPAATATYNQALIRYRAEKKKALAHAYQKHQYDKLKKNRIPAYLPPDAFGEYRYRDHSAPVLWMYAHKIASIVISAVLVVVLVLTITLSSIDTRFRIATVERIIPISEDSYYCSYERDVEHLLGKADMVEGDTWYYYSSNYKKLLNRANEIHEQMLTTNNFAQLAPLQEQLQDLYTKMEKLEYSSIVVEFEKEYLSLAVSSVRLDKTNSHEEKTAKKITLSPDSVYVGHYSSSYPEVSYAVTYTDGSYIHAKLPDSAWSNVDFYTEGEYTLTWSDDWGTYRAPIKVIEYTPTWSDDWGTYRAPINVT